VTSLADRPVPAPAPPAESVPAVAAARPPRWIKVIDQSRCIGCHACTTACKSENEVPLGVTRTYVKAVEVGTFPQARRAYQVTRCNQCADAPCVTACPTSAMFKRPDGIVDFDKAACIGCKACIAACPYDAIFINPEDHSAEKCNFCAHRIDGGLEPACVVVCPVEAILVGDLNDPTSRVAQLVERDVVAVRRPEKATMPGLFYNGAHQATLDPLAARRPIGDTYMWSERPTSGHQVVEAGHPGMGNSSAAALLAYDVPHRAPWDWRVSLYTWTKGVAAGVYIVALVMALTGVIGWDSPLWVWAAPVLGGAFLAATGLLLLLDLEHPARFLKIFTRPQWRSWLVRGALAISGLSVVLFLHFVTSVAGVVGAADAPGIDGGREVLAVAGLPLAVLTAVYTAYLFAQARARDLWQNPLLPAHFLIEAALAGSAVLIPVGAWLEPAAVPALALIVAATSAAHLLLVVGETTLTHVTAHARLAVHEMVAGRFRAWFVASIVLVAVGTVAPLGDASIASGAALAALAGLLAYEHAYVQAGQAVPLA
jgi:Fe-S-cluster-containing dehydrogenase component/formate-dependent nitrite reductase membrane component NrfD